MDPRWVTLSGTLFMESVSGSSYAFSVYSPQLKASLNFTQAHIETVASVGNTGLYAALLAGFAFDAAGPVVCGLVGAVLSAVGYVLMWASASGVLPASLGLVSLSAFIWSHGSSWLDVTAIAVNVNNFPADKGLVLGLSKSLFGLSASVLTLIYSCVFKPNVNPYLLFCGIFIPIVGGCMSLLLRAVPRERAKPLTAGEKRKIGISFAAVIALAAYSAAISVCISRGVLQPSVGFAYALAPLLGLHALQALPTHWFTRDTESARELPVDEGLAAALALHAAPVPSASAGAQFGLNSSDGEAAPTSQKTFSGASFFEAALDVDFLLFLVLLFVGSGSGVTMINNVGNITASLGGEQDSQDVYIVIISIFNCLGRMSFGAASDIFSRRLSRPGFVTLAVASMAGAMALSTIPNLNSLYLATAWTGFSYGAFWSLGPSFLAERYGNAAFASINALASMVTALASYVFSAVMASDIYEANITGGGTNCLGSQCYRLTFIVLALCNAGATIVGIFLTCKLRTVYTGENGKCVDFATVQQRRPVSAFIRSLQRALLPACCCGCGRWLLTARSTALESEAYLAEDESALSNNFAYMPVKQRDAARLA